MATTKLRAENPLPIPREFNLAERGIEALESIARFSNDSGRAANLLLGGVHPDGYCEGLCQSPEPKGTPLMMAAASGRAEIVKALLRAGANPYILDPYDYDALTHAGQGGSLSSIQALLEAADFNIERLRRGCLAATLSSEPSCAVPIATKLRALLERDALGKAARDPRTPAATPKTL